jgi:hypothetical protein
VRTTAPQDLLRVIAARTVDLRAEFEAQLRAVGRVEEQLQRIESPKEDSARRLGEALQREVTQMLLNNRNIRTVLKDLEIVRT